MPAGLQNTMLIVLSFCVSQRANILKEVQIMRGLRHGGIVELLAFTESREHYFLVLELMSVNLCSLCFMSAHLRIDIRQGGRRTFPPNCKINLFQ